MRSLATSISISYLALTALAVAIGVFSLLRFQEMGGSVGRILQGNYRSVRAAEGMVQALERQESARLYQRAGEPDAARTAFAAGRGAFAQWYAEAVTGAQMPEQPPLLDSIRIAYDAYVLAADAAFRAAGSSDSEAAEADVVPAAVGLRVLVNRLLEVNQHAMVVTRARVEAASAAAVRAVAIATLCVALAGGLLGFRFARRLTRPLRSLATAVDAVRRGSLGGTVPVEGRDEVGQLGHAFNAMTERLRHYDALNVEALVAEKRKQERLVEAMPSPVIATDEAGHIALLNEAARRLLGRPVDGDSWVGRPLTDAAVALAGLAGPMGDGAPAEPQAEAAEAGLLELPLAGVPRVYRPRRTAVPTADGSYTITLLEDVTPFRDLDRARRDFLAAVSHELRTPLTSLGVALDLLLRELMGPLSPDQRDLVETAKADQGRLKDLVAGLIDLARLEAGASPPEQAPLELRPLLDDALASFRLPASQRGVSLELDAPSTLPAVRGDARQLSWVASNLIGNALRHSPDEGVVRVRARAQAGAVTVTVEDEGPGVSAGAAESIFEPFVQGGRPGGVGLGLAIARRVVRAHGGRIWAEPRPGGGYFAFTLPRRRRREPGSSGTGSGAG